MARRYGASDEQIEGLEDPQLDLFTPAEQAALRFAEAMSLDAKRLDDADMAALAEHYSQEQIVEMACVIGTFNYLNRFAEAMGLWPTRPGEGGPQDPRT